MPPLRFRVQVQPRARATRLVGYHGEAIKLQVNAPPVDGAANRAVEALMARCLGLAKRDVRVVQGLSSRAKLVEVDTDDPISCRRRLEAALGKVDKATGRD